MITDLNLLDQLALALSEDSKDQKLNPGGRPQKVIEGPWTNPEAAKHGDAAFAFAPLLISDVHQGGALGREEFFGPIVALTR